MRKHRQVYGKQFASRTYGFTVNFHIPKWCQIVHSGSLFWGGWRHNHVTLTSQPRDHDDVIPWEKGGVKSNSRMWGMSRMPAITSYRGNNGTYQPFLRTRNACYRHKEYKNTNHDNRQVLWRVTYPKKTKSPECVEIWQIDRFRYEEYENNITDNRQPRCGYWDGHLPPKKI